MPDKDLLKRCCDEDTSKFLEIVLWNQLCTYFFCLTEEIGAELIQRFHTEFSDYFSQDFYFQDGAFHIATRIQYEYMLESDKPSFHDWLRDNDIFNQPEEASEYFRGNYYD